MFLADRDLKRRGPSLLDPFLTQNVQPASVDLRLDDVFLVPRFKRPLRTFEKVAPIDLSDVQVDHKRVVSPTFTLEPHQFILGSTIERVMVPPDLVAGVEGRSSLGRLGLFIHVTAGFIDPGFQGKITLEILNVNAQPIILHAGLRICQINFALMTQSASRPYGSPGLGSHYQGQTDVTASRYDG